MNWPRIARFSPTALEILLTVRRFAVLAVSCGVRVLAGTVCHAEAAARGVRNK